MRNTAPLLSALTVLFVLPSASAGIQFNFTFSDVEGTGFNAAGGLGEQRRGALSEAASSLASSFVGYDTTLSLTVSSQDVNNSTLAFASSTTYGSGNGFWQTVVERKVLTGVDDNGGAADGSLTFNFHHPWDYDDAVAGTAYDFKSTVMHELTHTLGFGSYLSASGQGVMGNPSGEPDFWKRFDQFVTNHAGTRVVTEDFRYNTSLTLAPLTGNPGLFFAGPNAMAAYGGLVPLYSPSVWQSGSSASHTDDTIFSGGNRLLMNSATGTGPGLRELGAVELAMMQDLGYAVVPEPEAVACWSGVGLLLYAGWRRRRQ